MIRFPNALFSAATKKGNASLQHTSVKTVNPITKLAHMRLDLGKVLTANNMPLIRQNVRNRKADSYADPDRVLALYTDFKHIRFELDQLRKKRNEHAALAKALVTIQDDYDREDKLKKHAEVGKSYKKQV